MVKSFKRVSTQESDLMRRWSSEGVGPSTIAARLKRSTDTVHNHVFVKPRNKRLGRAPPKLGRPPVVARCLFPKIVETYETMIAEADSKTEVTADKLKRRLRLKCDTKTLRRRLWENKIKFRPLYSKPTLTKDDISKRLIFWRLHKKKTKAAWQQAKNGSPHAIIDNKNFQAYLDGRFRDFAARRRVRGAYRGRGAKVSSPGYTKPPKSLKQNTGAKSVQVTCAIGGGRVLMWHVVPGRWNASAAADMYSKALLPALKKRYPTFKGMWRVLRSGILWELIS